MTKKVILYNVFMESPTQEAPGLRCMFLAKSNPSTISEPTGRGTLQRSCLDELAVPWTEVGRLEIGALFAYLFGHFLALLQQTNLKLCLVT